MKACLICGDYNMSAGLGGITADGKVLCGLCFTMAEFDRSFKFKDNTASDIVDYFVRKKIFFVPDTDIVTDLVWGVRQTVVQFDDERKLWRMVPFGKDGFRREAWLYRYSDIVDFELQQLGKYEETCDGLHIKITINEADGTAVYLTFIQAPYELKKSSNKYKRILATAKNCMSILRDITKTGSMSDSAISEAETSHSEEQR